MRACAVALIALVTLSGCGGVKMGKVSGRVTVSDKVVEGGTIQFVPREGKAAVGAINPDGTYTLTTYQTGDGAHIGPHKVVIHVTRVGAGSIVPMKFEDELKPPPNDSGMMLVPGRVDWIVPERYSQLATTDLTAEVQSGHQTLNFDVPSQ